MSKGFSITSFLFCFFALCIAALCIILIGKELVDKGVIELEKEISIEQKSSAIDVAEKAIQNYKIYKEDGWHEIELINNEWVSEDSYLEIRYFSYEKEPTIFFVILHPKSNIPGLNFEKDKDSMILGIGEKKDFFTSSNFKTGDRIISGFGITHDLHEENGMIMIVPPISEIEVGRNFLLVEDINATIEKFIIIK